MEEQQTEPQMHAQGDDINVGLVAIIGAFLATGLLVLVIFLQAGFYYADDAELKAKTLPQDSVALPYGAMVQEHQAILKTGDVLEDGKVKHHGLPIQVAMKLVVENGKYLSGPLTDGSN